MSEAGAAGLGATAAAAAAAGVSLGGNGGGAGALQQGSPAAGGLPACGPARAVIAAAAAATAESPAGGGSGGGSSSSGGGGLGSARIAGKKAQLRSAPRAKKLEKLGVYSACKVPSEP